MSTWMVVEDEPDIYEVLLAMFEMWGIEGVAFVDGEEAVAWIDDVDAERFQGELPELALLDIRLPGEVDGVQVGERLRKSPVLGDCAIVLSTAYKLTDSEREDAMKKSQADLWLPKPLPKFNALQGILEDVIAKRRAAKAGAGEAVDDKLGSVDTASANGKAKAEVTTESTDDAS
ncbi:MAG: response regulator [Chloroflexota bacterium]